MQVVEKALNELRKVMYILDFSSILLNTLIIFIFVLLLGTIFEFGWIASLVMSIIYLVVASIKSFFVNRFAIVESAVPELNEKIRTVADNVNKTNDIVEDLKKDVIRNMHKIKTSYFIDFNSLSLKLVILCSLAFLVVLISFINVRFDSADFGKVSGFLGIGGVRGANGNLTDVDLELMEGNLSSILGNNRSLAELSSKELSLLINPLESDVDLSKRTDSDGSNYQPPNFPKEIYTSYDATYSDKIAMQNQKVVKEYFERIAQ